MPKIKLHAGAEIDLLSKDELDQSLGQHFARTQTARGWGVKPIRKQAATTTIGTATAFAIQGPEQGYLWSLRLLGMSLSSAQSVQAWRAGDNGTTVPANGLLGNMASASFGSLTWSKGQALLTGGEWLALSAGGNTIVSYLLVAVEVPEQLAWKVM